MPGHVLVVEDDCDVAEVIVMLLKQEFGIRTHLAEDGQRALELVQQIRPSLVLLDINIPPPNGLEVLRKVKSDPATSHIPVIIVSTACEARAASEAGCADFIRKPFDIDDFFRKVEKYLPSQNETVIIQAFL